MKRALIALCLLLSSVSISMAQRMTVLGAGGVFASPPAAYTGPGDIVASASSWWGLRAYNAAVAATGTQKSAKLRRASDDTTQDILILTDGTFDIASAVSFAGTDATGNATSAGTSVALTGLSGAAHVGDTITGAGFVGSTCVAVGSLVAGAQTCTTNTSQSIGVSEPVTLTWGLYVDTLYDQASTRNLANATTSAQPQILPGSRNGHPTILWKSASSTVLSSSGTFGLGIPFTESTVAEFNTNGAAQTAMVIGHIAVCIYRNTTNTMQLYAGSTGGAVTVNDGTWNALQAVFNNASSKLYVNTSSNSQTPGAGDLQPADTIHLGGTVDCGNSMDGEMGEFGFWPVGFSSGDASSMRGNQSTYWGTP